MDFLEVPTCHESAPGCCRTANGGFFFSRVSEDAEWPANLEGGFFLLIFVWVTCESGTKRWYHALQNRIFDSASAPFPTGGGGQVNSVPAFSAVLRVF